MKSLVFGERVRGFLAAHRVPQKALAAVQDQDPGYLSRRLDDPRIDPWDAFLLGFAAADAVNQVQQRQSAP